MRKAIGKDYKGKLSVILYTIGIVLTLVNPWLAISCYIFVAIMWIIPDKRIERNIE